MKLPAPGKVNLQLKVLGRRADGFHEIESLIVPISLADEISIEVRDGGAITVSCDEPGVPGGEKNLAAKAALEFFRYTGLPVGAHISIRKRVPLGAGLGGGSSDAAAVLVALDSILGTRLGVARLEEMAAKLGSDVPFFIRGRPAICRGRGEIIEPIDLPETLNLLLLKPPFAVETPWAYNAWADSRVSHGSADEGQNLGWTKIFNALERPVFEKFLVLPVMKEWLKRQPEIRAAGMSGSGSTLFAIMREVGAGRDLEARLKTEFGNTMWTSLCEAPL